jgi:hypothetical protein
MSKLWIIGDSFTGSLMAPKKAWTQQVSDKFKGDCIVKSKPSRDFQTILDIFLRNLKDIKENDFVILTIPSLARIRLPRAIPARDIEHSNMNINFQSSNDYRDYFIGAWSYTKETDDMEYRLEEPLFEFTHEECIGKLQIQSIINSSLASKNNYIDILKSLIEYLPFKIFIWSWQNEINSDIITNKDKITEEIGFWHTLYDEWKETEGKSGTQGDHHFSEKMHNAFADYLIVKFPQFFNV